MAIREDMSVTVTGGFRRGRDVGPSGVRLIALIDLRACVTHPELNATPSSIAPPSRTARCHQRTPAPWHGCARERTLATIMVLPGCSLDIGLPSQMAHTSIPPVSRDTVNHPHGVIQQHPHAVVDLRYLVCQQCSKHIEAASVHTRFRARRCKLKH